MPRDDVNRYARARNPLKTIGRLLSFLKDEVPKIAFAFVCTVLASLLTVLAAHWISPIVTSIHDLAAQYTQNNLDQFIRYLVYLGVTYLGALSVQYLSDRTMTVVTNHSLNKIRNNLFNEMQRLPVSYFDTHTHGELMSYYTNDVGALRDALGDTITSFVSAAVTLAGSFVMMILISPLLTLATVALIVVLGAVTGFVGSRSISNFKNQQSAVAKLNGYMEEMMGGQKVVKVFNHEQQVKDEFNTINEEARRSVTRATIYGGVMGPISNNLNHINYALCSIFGGYLVIKGSISVDRLIEFLQHSRNFSNPLSRIMQMFTSLTRAVAAAERIFDVLDLEDEPDTGTAKLVYMTFDENNSMIESSERTGLWAWKLPHEDGSTELVRLRGDVRFFNVNFSYDGKKKVLNDISFYAKPGQKIAFVGSTGAGKTTIINLIDRFYDYSEGLITYDGIDIRNIRKADLRRSLAMVLQDTHLFTGTVMDNIRYGRQEATEEEVIAAAKLANADEFITMLPEGYNTVLTDDGSSLSAGQRQLLAIARAAVMDAPVLILDEATSSIDTRTEKLIEQGMDNLMAGRTVFVIAHRLSTVRNANAIVVLEHGEIIERGSHDDLIAARGKYYQLYTGQFELD